MCEESVRGWSITCGQVIFMLLTGEFAHCIPPSPSLGVMPLEWMVVGSSQRSLK